MKLSRYARLQARVLATGLLGLFLQLPAAAAPKLVAPKPEVEIGALIAGETAEAEFPIENTGDSPLQIAGVATSCGCTTTSYPKTLAPGEKAVVKAQLVSSPLWSGRVTKEITVTSNDPEHPTLPLRLVADMRPLFQFSPGNPVVANYKKGDVIRQIVTIAASADPAARVLDVTANAAEAEARLLPAEPSDAPGTARVEVIVIPPKQGGDITEHLMLKTSHAKVPTVPLVVSLLSQDAVTVQPRVLYWAVLAAGSPADATRLITLQRRAGTFRVLTAVTEHASLVVEIRRPEVSPAAEGGNDGNGTPTEESYQEILLRYSGGLPKGTTRGTLTITTTDPGSPVLSVPYQLMIP